MERWLAKAHRELKKQAKIIAFLVFANTDTKWFHRYCLGRAELRFIQGRLKFRDAEGKVQNPAMRPSMLVIFRKKVLQDERQDFTFPVHGAKRYDDRNNPPNR